MPTTSRRSHRMIFVASAFALLLLIVIGFAYNIAYAGDKAPAVGTAAPDFTLSSQENKQVSLHDFKGKWVVLYFYPKDFTRGCPMEAPTFQRDQAQYEAK